MNTPNIDDAMDAMHTNILPCVLATNVPNSLPHILDELDNADQIPCLRPNYASTTAPKVIDLCTELKSYDEHDNGKSITNVVSGFNTQQLFKKLTRSSNLFDVDIDIDELCKELFCAEEWWANRDLLFNALVSFGEIKGFRVAEKHAYIKCNRYGKKEYIRNDESGGLCVECKFILNLKALHNPKSAPKWGGMIVPIPNKKQGRNMISLSRLETILAPNGQLVHPRHMVGYVGPQDRT